MTMNTTLLDETSNVIGMPGNSFFILAFFITIPNVCAFLAMWKTKGIPSAIKIPIMNLMLSGIFSGTCFLIQYVLMHTLPVKMHRSVCYSGITLTLLCASGSFSIITSVAIDRCVCLYFEYAYMKLLTARRVIIFQGCVWGLACCLALSIFSDISSDFEVCLYRNVVGVIGRRLHIIYGILFRIVSAFSYILIYRKIRILTKSIGRKNQQRMFSNTFKLLLIGITYHGMYFPMLCHQLYLLIFPDEFEKTQIVSIFVSSLTVVNIFINPFIYAWRFPECRLQLTKMICFWNKNIAMKGNERRKRILVSYLDPIPLQN